MEVLQERAEKMEDEGHKNFANNMCQYIHSQWIEGPSFCVKDWNVFHVGFFNWLDSRDSRDSRDSFSYNDLNCNN